MAVFETWLKSDLKKPVVVQKLVGNLFSADNGGNLIGVEVMDNGSQATLTGGVMGYIIREDGETVTVSGTLSGNKASIVLPASAYVVVGHVSIVIKVGTTTVGACTGYVYRTTTDTLVDPGHIIPSVEELLAKIGDCEAATTAATTAASNANTKAALADEKATLANTKAGLADTAAGTANTAAGAANTAASKIDGMTVAISAGDPTAQPTATLTLVNGHYVLTFNNMKGVKGDTGDAFHVVKTYASVSAMNADYSGTDVKIGEYVMIVSTVEDPDNAKVYIKGSSAYSFVVDMSGATGIQGQQAFVHIKYAENQPTQDSDMSSNPNKWIGIYSGTSETAPTSYSSYSWFKFKGEPGNATVDDTAGTGDTEKVWSADKLVGEFADKADKTDTVLNTTLSRGRKANTTVGTGSFAFGNNVEASGDYSHAEGAYSKASGESAHVEGEYSEASQIGSHAEGYRTLASSSYQHVFGQLNVEDTDDEFVEIVGNGHEEVVTPSIQRIRSNARTLDWDGNERLAGDLFIGCNDDSTGGKQVGTAIEALETGKADAIKVSDATAEAVKTLADGADGMPMAVTVGIEPVQSGTGDPSPTNIRPISGRTGATITNNSANLIPDGTNTDKGYQKDKYLKTDGTVGTSDTSNYISEYFPVEPNGTYTMRTEKRVLNNSCVCFYDENKNYISGSAVNYQQKTKTITAPATAVWARATQCYDTSIDFAQFERGSVPTEIVPYSHNEYQIDFPDGAGTVYGGTLTVNKDGTGELKVEYAGFTLPTITEFYGTTSQGSYKYTRPVIDSSLLKDGNSITTISEAVKSIKQSATKTAYSCYVDKPSNGTESIYVICDTDTTVEYYNTNIAGTKVIAKLKSADEYDLTAEQVVTVLGVNNIFADTGDILSVDYSADTKMYVDAGDENTQEQVNLTRDMIADSDTVIVTESHVIGDVFICNNQLLRATDAIATGETVIIGSNAEVINLADYIKEQVTAITAMQPTVATAKEYLPFADNMPFAGTMKLFVNPNGSAWDFNKSGGNTGRSFNIVKNVVKRSATSSSTTYKYFLLYGGTEIKTASSFDNLKAVLDSSDFITIPTAPANNDIILQIEYDLNTTDGGGHYPEGINIATIDGEDEISSLVTLYLHAGNATYPSFAKGVFSVNLSKDYPSVITNGKIALSDYSRHALWAGTIKFNFYATPTTN